MIPEVMPDVDVLEGDRLDAVAVERRLAAAAPQPVTYEERAPIPAPHIVASDSNRERWDPRFEERKGDVNTKREVGMEKNHAVFYSKPRWNKNKSKAAMRPIYDAKEYVRIMTPGDRFSVVDRPARDQDKRVYHRQYALYLQGKDQNSDGTSLVSSGIVSPERAEELKYFKIVTVEHLAAVSDDNLEKIGMTGRKEREAAQRFLAASKAAVESGQLQAELEKRDATAAAQAKQIADLEAKLAALTASNEPAEPLAAPKRRGRPPKAAQTEEA